MLWEGPLSYSPISSPLIISTPSFLHPLLWVYNSAMHKCSALYVKTLHIILEALLYLQAVYCCNILTGSTTPTRPPMCFRKCK